MASDIDPKIDPAFKAVVSEKKLLLGFLRDLFDYVKFPEPIDVTYEEDLSYETLEIERTGFHGKAGRLDLCVTLKNQLKNSCRNANSR